MPDTRYFLGIFANISNQQPLDALSKEADELWNPFRSDKRVDWHIVENIDYNRIANNFGADVVNNALIVHYGGHSSPTDIALADGDFPMVNILDQLGVNYQNVKLVFLNSCEALEQADTLLERGVKMVIASPKTVGDNSASLFAKQFYLALANRFSVNVAYQKAIHFLKDTQNLHLQEQIVCRTLPASKRHGYIPTPVQWWTLCYKEDGVIQETFEDWLPKNALHPAIPKELTQILPKTQPDDIVGRSKTLEELYQLLHQQKKVVVNGMVGLGKTTVASAYLTRYYEEYHHIVWITQNPNSNLIADFTNTAGLKENLQIDAQLYAKSEDLYAEILRRLKALHNKPNLLIIDNAANEVLKKQLTAFPGQPHWHLLATAREKLDGFTEKLLGFLSEADALILFNKYYTLPDLTETDKKTLLQAIGYHTLTIEILAKTAQKQRYPAQKLFQALPQDLRANITATHSQHENIERIMSYLRSIFSLSGIQEQELWVLLQFICLPTEWHRFDLLQELCTAPDSKEADFFSETLTNLFNKGWLQYALATNSYKMHPIITEVVKQEQTDQLTTQTVAYLLQNLTEKLSLDQSKDNSIDKFVWIPYGKSLATLFAKNLEPQVTEFMVNFTSRLTDLRKFASENKILIPAPLTVENIEGKTIQNILSSKFEP